VEVEVELWPTTALIRKGNRIRLDVQPTDGVDHPSRHYYDETYHKGASNTIYIGPDHPSYLQLPVIPPKA
jgi:predicted acyl esterase